MFSSTRSGVSSAPGRPYSRPQISSRTRSIFETSGRQRHAREDFGRVFEDDPFNPDDAWGASRTNNVRPFFNFERHAGQKWGAAAEDAEAHTPDESDFWFFNIKNRNQQGGSTQYYYHEYHHAHDYRRNANANARSRSGSQQYGDRHQVGGGKPDLQMARHAFNRARDAAASRCLSESDLTRAEDLIAREIGLAMQHAALDIVVFAKALDCEFDAASSRSAKRSLVQRYHPDKVLCVGDGDGDAERARKRLQSRLGHAILTNLSRVEGR